jgi:nucleoid-associated protein YgaU
MSRADEYYDEYEGDFGGRVLWGRIAFFGVALLLAFGLGWCTSPSVSEEELAERDSQVERLRAEVEELRQQRDALDAGTTTEDAPATEDDPADPDADTGASATAPEGSETYEVQSGDTLRSIAEDFYGDGDLTDPIAEANGIDSDNLLQVGQELVIPPADS